MQRPWPGNIRELRNFVDRALVLGATEALGSLAPSGSVDLTVGLPKVPVDQPFKLIREHHKGNVSAVATAAGLNRTYVHRLIRKHDL